MLGLLRCGPRAFRAFPPNVKRFSSSVNLVQSGAFGTLNWRGSFVRDGTAISPWHDINIRPAGKSDDFYTFVNEIPAGSFEKIEVSTHEPWNPLKQDSKKGKPRLYGLKTAFNYGCFPQTWENPWRHSKRIAAVGDGDPVDAVELGWLGGGAGALPLGAVTAVRVLGCLALIDEGEVDWKVHLSC
jgi:inorganic pyrophosphatase